VSSITQAKAEAQKLIRRYNQLQAEAKTADANEAARKAAEADKLVSQISALQLAITKLQQQGREDSPQKNAVQKAPAQKHTAPNKPKSVSTKEIQHVVSEKKKLEARMNRLEEAQKKTRAQIAQLTRAKDDLARLKRKAEQSVATIAKERSANDEKLQQELAKRIKKKEDEYKVLKRELEVIRQQSQKDTELLKTQRDTARAIIERQKKEQSTPQKQSHKGPLIIVGSIATVSFILGIFLASLFASEKNTSVGPLSQTPNLMRVDPDPDVTPKPNHQTEKKARETDRDQFKELFGPKMIKLPAGTMKIIGKNQDDIKEVTFPSFSMSKYEITFKEYDLFAIANNHELPETENKKRGMQPVTGVSWYNAEKYTQWLSNQTGYIYRLPTEGEWEYAARAGADHTLEHFKQEQTNCKECYGQWDGRTVQVKSFLPNPFLVYEMIGNVMEWTNSCYRSKVEEALAAQDNEGADCSKRIARGVHYMTPKQEVEELRASNKGKREKLSPRTKRDYIGFRVVREE
jgi:formylglycine-generating enzyme required for sulfatase activity